MTGIAALAIGAAFTSCSKDVEQLSQEELQQYEIQKIKSNYEQAFVKVFGTANNRDNWGFSDTKTRTAAPNANLWGAEWNVPLVLTTSQKTAVRLYFQYNNQPQGISINYKNFFVQDVYKGATTPLNDGTEAMAAYSTEKYNFNGTQEAGSAHMDYLTAGSDNDHIANYNNAKCSTNNNVTYYGVYVDGYTPQTAYDDPVNWEVNNRNNLAQHSDEIQLMTDSKTDCFGWYETQGSIHHNDKYVIIDGTTIQTWAEGQGISIDVPLTGRQFVGFDYEAQVDLDDLYAFPDGWDEYVWNSETNSGGNVHFEGIRTNGDGIPYLKNNTNMYSCRIVPAGTEGAYPVWERDYWVIPGCADGYYSDWIVCITEGIKMNTVSANLRVMAEDLSAGEDGDDFDFNDVVFDVYFSATEGEAYVMVLAAGGTLPLKVNGTEVHGLFGKTAGTNGLYPMINTHAEDKGLPGESGLTAQKIQLTGITVNSKTDANQKIKIEVLKSITTADGVTSQQWIELENTGAAACKIGVSPTINWANERENINSVCTMNQWVSGGTLEPTHP